VFVDLVKNKETYTAFDGMQVWSAIYQDNCMLVDGVNASTTCSDHTLLFQLVSGLHTSINMHVAMNYFDQHLGKIVPNL
jgi:ERO1-like protein alpha